MSESLLVNVGGAVFVLSRHEVVNEEHDAGSARGRASSVFAGSWSDDHDIGVLGRGRVDGDVGCEVWEREEVLGDYASWSGMSRAWFVSTRARMAGTRARGWNVCASGVIASS